VYVLRVCGRRTKEATKRKPVECNRELKKTGGERLEVGDRIQIGIKGGKYLYVVRMKKSWSSDSG
jgi:hypothetical protein